MRYPIFKSVLLMIALYTLQSFNSTPQWLKAGTKPSSYIMGLDSNMKRNQRIVNSIKSKEEFVDGFGSYVTEMKPGKFAGKLIRITGYVKKNDTSNVGGLWVMTDGTFAEKSNRASGESEFPIPLMGEKKDWHLEEIKVYVPVDATNIAYGGFLQGGGQIWFDDVSLEVVDETVEGTDMH